MAPSKPSTRGLSYPVAVAYTVGAPVYLQPVLAGGQGGAAFAVEPELPAGFRLYLGHPRAGGRVSTGGGAL